MGQKATIGKKTALQFTQTQYAQNICFLFVLLKAINL